MHITSCIQSDELLFSDVPRDFIDEEKEITRVRLLPRELCFLYDLPEVRKHVYLNYTIFFYYEAILLK